MNIKLNKHAIQNYLTYMNNRIIKQTSFSIPILLGDSSPSKAKI
jgi:hypothetical protein